MLSIVPASLRSWVSRRSPRSRASPRPRAWARSGLSARSGLWARSGLSARSGLRERARRRPAGWVAVPGIAGIAAAAAAASPGYVRIAPSGSRVVGPTIECVALLAAYAAAATYMVCRLRAAPTPRSDRHRVLTAGALGVAVGVALSAVGGAHSATSIAVGLAAAVGATAACLFAAYMGGRRAGPRLGRGVAEPARRLRRERQVIALALSAVALGVVAAHHGRRDPAIATVLSAVAVALAASALLSPVATWIGLRSIRVAEPSRRGRSVVEGEPIVLADFGGDLATETASRPVLSVAEEHDRPTAGQSGGGNRFTTGDGRFASGHDSAPATRGLVAASAYLARRPGVHGATSLTIAALVVAGAAAFASSSAARATHERAAHQLGADRVLTVAAVPPSQLLSAVRAADPGGEDAMAVAVLPNGDGPTVVAVDAGRLSMTVAGDVGSGPPPVRLAALIRPAAPTPAVVDGQVLRLNVTAAGDIGVAAHIDARLVEVNGTIHRVSFGPLRSGEHVYVAESTCPVRCTIEGFAVAGSGVGLPPAVAMNGTGSIILRDLRQAAPDRIVLAAAAFADPSRWSLDSASRASSPMLATSESGLDITLNRPIQRPEISLDAGVPIPAVSGPAAPSVQAVTLPGLLGTVPVRNTRMAVPLPGVPAHSLLIDLDDAVRVAGDRAADSTAVAGTSQVWLAAGAPAGVIDALRAAGLRIIGETSIAQRAAAYDDAPQVVAARTQFAFAAVALLCAACLIGAVIRAHRGARTLARGIGFAAWTWLVGMGGAIIARHIAPDAALAVAAGRAPPPVGLVPFVIVAAVAAAALGLLVVAAARSAPWHPRITDPPRSAQSEWDLPDTDGRAIAGRGRRASG